MINKLLIMKRVLFLLPMLVALFVFVGCSEDKDNEALVLIDLYFTPEESKIVLEVGDKYQLSPSTTPENYPKDDFKWYIVEGEDLGTLDAKGLFIAEKPGKVRVKVVAPGSNQISNSQISAYCDIQINGDSEAIQPSIDNIVFEKELLNLKVGRSSTMSFEIQPADAKNEKINWSVSDTSIITIEQAMSSITVFGVGVGNAEVFTVINDKRFSFNVEVEPVQVESIEVSPTEKVVKEKESFTLVCKVLPEDATNKDLIFSSSDENVATVDEKGKIEALKPGKCTIVVSTKEGNVSASCELTVIDAPIEELVKVSVYGSMTSFNGITTGDVTAAFYNNSSKTVYVKSLKMYNTYNNRLVFEKYDLGEVVYREPIRVDLTFSRVYKPLFVWVYECEGETYEVEYLID